MNIFNIEDDLNKDIRTGKIHASIKNREVDDIELERDYYKGILSELSKKIKKQIIVYDSKVFFEKEDVKVFCSGLEDEGLETGDYLGRISIYNFGQPVNEVSIIIGGEHYELYKFTLY